jgi:hypothetical protein
MPVRTTMVGPALAATLPPTWHRCRAGGTSDVQLWPPLQLGVQGDGIEDDEPGGGSFGHGDGNRPVRFYHRGGLASQQLRVRQPDLGPVGVFGVSSGRMTRSDGRVQLMKAGSSPAEGVDEQCLAFGDELVIPSSAVLVLEEDETGVVHAAATTPVDQQQQGEEPLRLWFLRHQVDDPARQRRCRTRPPQMDTPPETLLSALTRHSRRAGHQP